MAKYYKIVLLFAFLFIKQINLAQTPSLSEITLKADNLIGENKDKEALRMLEDVNIDDYNNENDEIIASFYFVKATAYDLNEDSSNSIRMFEKACDHYEKAGITYDRYLQSLQSLGRIYYKLGKLVLSEKCYKKIIIYGTPSQLFKNDELNDLDFVSNAFYNLGIIFADKDEYNMAEKCLPKVMQKNVVSHEKAQNILYNYLFNKLFSKTLELRKDEKYEDAIIIFDKLLSLIEWYSGRLDDKFLQVSFNKALVLGYDLGLYKEAIPILNYNIGIRNLIDFPNRDICSSYCFLTMYLSASKEYDKVQEVLTDGFDYLREANFADYPPHMLYRFAGNGSYGTNDYTTAISYYEKYLDSNNPKEGATNYEEIVNMLSVAYILSDYPDKAQKLLKSFLKDSENAMIVSNPTILANIYHNLGRAIMLVRNYKDALIYLNKSKDLQMKLYGEATSRTIDYIKECIHNK